MEISNVSIQVRRNIASLYFILRHGFFISYIFPIYLCCLRLCNFRKNAAKTDFLHNQLQKRTEQRMQTQERRQVLREQTRENKTNQSIGERRINRRRELKEKFGVLKLRGASADNNDADALVRLCLSRGDAEKTKRLQL